MTECPACRKLISFTSDVTGNVRRYHCKACGGTWIVTLKGMPSSSVMAEPQNVQKKDMEWVKVLK